MNKKLFSAIFIPVTLIFLVPTIVFAQVAAPATGPLITSINPSSSERGQNIGMVIVGKNFKDGAQLTFRPSLGIFINSIVVTVEKITANISIASDAPTTPRDVIITNPDKLTATYNDGFLIKTPTDLTPPPPILGLTAIDALDGKIDLAWTKSDALDFDHYSIYWKETEFVNVTGLTPAATISDQNTVAFQATGLTDGIKYYFAVTAVDNAGNEDKNVSPADVTPTQATVPPVTVPFPTAPAVNEIPAPTAPPALEKKTGEALPAGLIPIIIVTALAALGGLIYSLKKHGTKNSSDKKVEIKKEEKIRFLNKNSKLTKLEITTGGGKNVDLIREIINLKLPDFSPTENGFAIDTALKIFDTKKETLQKILGEPILAKESDTLQYTIIISPVSGIDIEWKMAEVSFGGIKPTGKYEIKKQGDNFTYEKNVKVAKTDEAWKKYADTLTPNFIDLKKILQNHLDDLGKQEEKFKNLEGTFCSIKSC